MQLQFLGIDQQLLRYVEIKKLIAQNTINYKLKSSQIKPNQFDCIDINSGMSKITQTC